MRRKLSVTVIAGAEAGNIGDCLASVSWADEIVVVNSLSNDGTVEIARRHTERVLTRAWTGFADQKAFALAQATGDWVLSLDADERVTPELRAEIESLLAGPPSPHAGYQIPRRNFFLGRWIRHAGWYPGYQLRLFDRQKVSVTQRKVHEGFVVDGTTGRLRGDLIHFTHPTVAETLRKIDHYSTLEAEERVGRRRVTGMSVVLHPLAAFFQSYLLRRAFLDGAPGLMVALFHALTNGLTYMKMWELQHPSRSSAQPLEAKAGDQLAGGGPTA